MFGTREMQTSTAFTKSRKSIRALLRLSPPTPERPIGEVQVTYPHIYLVNVVDRGVTYPVPNSHGGGPISKAHPNNVGLLALRFLEECLKEAEQFTTDQKLSSSPP